MSKELEFLELYRTYEGQLRDAGVDYKTLEEKSDDLLQNRMRICRQMRNYLSHQNDAGFLNISEKQIEFLKDRIREQELQGDILQNHLVTVRAGSCKPEDTLDSVYRKMKRNHTQYLPICEGNHVVGVLSITDVVETLLKGLNLVSSCKTSGQIVCKPPVTCMEDLPAGVPVICCTEDGRVDKKCFGIWFAE